MRVVRSTSVLAVALVSSFVFVGSSSALAQGTNVCTPTPFSGAPAAPNTLIDSEDAVPNSNPTTELNFVKNALNNNNVVEVPCTFSNGGQATNGTWSSQSNVTHILVKADGLRQVFAVNNAPTTSGVWTSECIQLNNAAAAFSHGRCYATTQPQTPVGKIIIRKETVDGNSSFEFDPSSGANFFLSNGQELELTNLAPGTYTFQELISAAQQADGWSFDLNSSSCTVTGNDGSTGNLAVTTATIEIKPNTTGDTLDTVKCTFVNKRVSQVTRKLTIIKETIPNGDPQVFTFTGMAPSGPVNFNLQDNQAGEEFTDAGAYDITEMQVNGYDLTSVSCTGDFGQGVGGDVANTANGVQVTLEDDEEITCTFVNKKKGDGDDRMDEETKRFIHRRVDNLLSHDPDRARMLRRLGEQERPVSLKDGPIKFSGEQPIGYQVNSGATTNVGGAMALGGNANGSAGSDDRLPWVRGPFDSNYENTFGYEPDNASATSSLFASFASQLAPMANGAASFKFGTSLSEIRAKAAEAEARTQQKKLEEAGLSFAGQPYLDPTTTLRQGFDFWAEGHISRYSDDIGGINRDGDFRILYVGADYVLAPHILVGALVQIDDTNEDLDDPTQTGEIDGTGWMVGPYAGVKLLDNLFLDARAAWGQSDNDIWLDDPVFGFRTGSFDTERWLATTTLTGVYYHGAWRFSPQAGIAYGHESFDTYTTSAGQIVLGDDANIGRLTGGVEVGYRMQARYGVIVEPHVALNGIWNFDSDDLFINGVLTETDDNRAEVEGGVMVTTLSGWSVRAAGRYDGIGGEDFESYGGSLWVNVPLHTN